MKSISFIITVIALYATVASAQAPQSFKYQTVVRNANGEIIASQPVNITLSILQGSITGTSVCTELFQSTTNEFGLVNLEIGSKDPDAFSAINWANGPYFIRVSLDGNLMGTSQFLSVPYALYAEQSGNAGGTELWSGNGNNIYYNGGNVGIGTTSPSCMFHINGGSTSDLLKLSGLDGTNLIFNDLGENSSFSLRVAGIGPTMQIRNGTNTPVLTFLQNGNIGISNSNPGRLLQIDGDIEGIGFEGHTTSPNAGAIRFGDNTGWKLHIGRNFDYPGGNLNTGSQGAIMTIVDDGKIGIGNTNPIAKLHVSSYGGNWGNPSTLIENTGTGDQVALGFRNNGTYDWEFAGIHDGRLIIRDEKNQIAKITIYPGASGAVAVPVLEITGGSDLAEPFPIAQTLAEGTVVIIDESNPGHLMESNQPYDKKVAGIVSGAGGIQPGLTLKQEGVMEGSQNIALTGRVYVKATSENGSIKPGDRLTTSNTPGHAMKATNKKQCDGAVIGKAMSSLEEGEGLVLVLVNLQ